VIQFVSRQDRQRLAQHFLQWSESLFWNITGVSGNRNDGEIADCSSALPPRRAPFSACQLSELGSSAFVRLLAAIPISAFQHFNFLPIPIPPNKFRLTSLRLQAKLTQVKIVMPEQQKKKAEIRKREGGNMIVCHNVPLWAPMASAFGNATKCPATTLGIPPPTTPHSPSSSGIIPAQKLRLIKLN
jgi:hypothetical protein